MAAERDRRPSYFKAAFANVYNLTLLSGVAVAAMATGEPWLLAVGAAAEALWLLFSTDNPRFKRAVDSRHSAADRLDAIRRMQEESARLPHQERLRVQLLGSKAAEVKAETMRNPRIAGDFLNAQLARLDDLVGEFVHLSVTANRSESYLARSDARQINRDREAQRKLIEATDDEGTRDIARQNHAILEKRLTIIGELEKFIARARGQMSLIENTISLLRDQVMTMAEPEALSVQLDTLVASVDAIRDATRQADAIVGSGSSSLPSFEPLEDPLAVAGAPLDASERESAPAPAGRTRRRTRD